MREPEMQSSMGDGTDNEPRSPYVAAMREALLAPDAGIIPPAPPPCCVEVGTRPAGWVVRHTEENRQTRRQAVAEWKPPGPDDPTRRELVKQRQKHARGKLDVQTRRIQRAALAAKGRK